MAQVAASASSGHYQQLRFYDPFTDRPSIRISMFDSRGSEFWCVLPLAPEGRSRREARERALDALVQALDEGKPGEVKL